MRTHRWWAGLAVMGAAITIAWLAPGWHAMAGKEPARLAAPVAAPAVPAVPATAPPAASRLAHFDAIPSAARAEREKNGGQLPERPFPDYPRHSGR